MQTEIGHLLWYLPLSGHISWEHGPSECFHSSSSLFHLFIAWMDIFSSLKSIVCRGTELPISTITFISKLLPCLLPWDQRATTCSASEIRKLGTTSPISPAPASPPAKQLPGSPTPFPKGPGVQTSFLSSLPPLPLPAPDHPLRLHTSWLWPPSPPSTTELSQ